MTDTDSEPTDTIPSSADSDAEPVTDDTETTDDTARSILHYAQWAAFGILVLVALIATLQFYFSASEVIRTFVTRRYRPLFSAGFNLLILLSSAAGITLLVRRLS